MNKSFWKSVGVVVLGAVVGSVLSVLTDSALEALHIFPMIGQVVFASWMLVLATVYRCIYTALGGYITAAASPENARKNVMILGIVALLANGIGLVTTWGKGLGPEWYPIALTLLAYPSALLGGRMKK